VTLRRRLSGSALALAALLASCAPLTGTQSTASPDLLSGTYNVKGGGAALEVFQGLSDAFRKQHPTVRFSFEDVGSAAGMKLAATGDVDLATSSAIPSADITNSLVVVPVGASGTAVIVNAANSVTALTKTQVRDIFAGSVVTWSAVGGGPEPIIVVIREATSALRGNFDAYFFGGKGVYRADAIELNTGDDIVRAVTSRTGVISMLTISAAVLGDQRIRALTIDGIAASKINITTGRYPVTRPLFLVYNEKYLKPGIAAFLEFVRGPDGQRIIEQVTGG
jgi:phosphate transport system substrate-binding protein